MSFLDVAVNKVGPSKLHFEWMATQRTVSMQVIPLTLSRLKATAPVSAVKPDAGRFRGSIGFRLETTPGMLTIKFVSTAPYAQYVIEGTTSTGPIFPSSAMALRWSAPGGYKFASSVKRRPTHGNDFSDVVAAELLPYYEKTFSDALVVIAT